MSHSHYPSPSPPLPPTSFSFRRPLPNLSMNDKNPSSSPARASPALALSAASPNAQAADLNSPLPSPPLSLSMSMAMPPPPPLTSMLANASDMPSPSSLVPVPVCYRHRPDIQANPFHQSWRPDLDSLLAALPTEQRSAVTAIWSTFAAASAPIRDLILLGLVDTCCMRQLTTLHRALEPAMKMDVLTQLPVELSLRVLGYLDARSLCRASQVSKAWARLANCDSVWHRLCLQHIDKKCVKCGWALPLLTKKRKRRCVSDPAADAAKAALAAIAPPPPPPPPAGSTLLAAAADQSALSSSLSGRPVVHCSGQMPIVTPPPSTSKPASASGCSSIPVSALLNPTSSSSTAHATYDSATSDSDDYLSEECDADAARQTHSIQEAYRYRGRPGYRGGMTKRARLNPSGPAAASNSTALSSSRSSTSSLIDHLATSPLPPTTLHVSSPGGNTGAAPLVRRSWKLIYAERLLIGRNWRSNTHAAYSLVPPTASLQPRVTACHLDEPYLMTSAMDGLVRLWHLESRTCLVTLAGHRGAVTSVHFDDAHGLAVSGGMDGTVRLWNWATGQCVRTLTGGHAVPVTALSFDQGILATADAASLIRVWDFSARTCFALCHGNQCAVTRVALCRGSLVSAGEDGVVRMWDLNTRSCTRTFAPRGADPVPGLAPAVTSMHVAQVHVAGGRHAVYVMAGMADGWAHVYVAVQPAGAAGVGAGQVGVGVGVGGGEAVVAPLRSMNHGAPITSVWFDSLRVLTCGTDGQVHLWDLDTGDKIRSYSVGGSAGVVTGSDTRIVCAREDGVVHVWDFGSTKDNKV